MNGWIKLEKALETDPRVLRAARSLARRAAAGDAAKSCNASALQYVTVVIGGLARLWMLADSHAGADDTVELSFEEIDEMLGVPGFCESLPSDWIISRDGKSSELPGFQQHNGSDARRRALTAQRVANHRSSTVKRDSVTPCNADALPDKTRQDKTREKKVPSEPLSGDAPERGAVDRVFDHWRTTHNHPNARLDERRRRIIRAALETYSEADLCLAISGYKNSPHHMGQNDRSTVYDSVELFLRDAKHIDSGIAFARNPPRAGLAAITRANADATADWKPPEVRRAG